MSAPKHYAPWYKQLVIDIRPWITGIAVTVLCASVVTLIGLLMMVEWGWGVTGPMVILVGLVGVTLFAALWAADKMVPGDGVAA